MTRRFLMRLTVYKTVDQLVTIVVADKNKSQKRFVFNGGKSLYKKKNK